MKVRYSKTFILISGSKSFGNFLLNAVRKPARSMALACRLGYILFPGGNFASNSICTQSMGSNPSTMAEISSGVRGVLLFIFCFLTCIHNRHADDFIIFITDNYIVIQQFRIVGVVWSLEIQIQYIGLFIIVGFDLRVDFLAMTAFVSPRVRKIFRAQGGIGLEQICFACSQAPRLHQQPNRNARADNARFPAAYLRIAFYAREGISQVTRGPLE